MDDQHIHPSQLSQLWDSWTASTIGSWACLGASLALLGLGVESNSNYWRSIYWGSGIAVCNAAKPLRKSQRRTEAMIRDWEDVSDDAFQRWLFDKMQPSAPPLLPVAVEPQQLEFFNFGEIVTDPDRFPHLLLLGKTGAGKSWLGERLAKILGGETLIVSPHLKPSDFVGYQRKGKGRNYAQISETLAALNIEMQNRYELYSEGVENYPPLNVVLDEVPAIMKNCKNASDIIADLAREARKVRIRLIMLSQGGEVKTLGIEGEGSLRECFTYIRLRGFIKSHLKQLKNDDLTAWVKSQRYPCLVEDLPADTKVLASLPAAPVPAPTNSSPPDSTTSAPLDSASPAPLPNLGASVSAPEPPTQPDDPLDPAISPQVRGWVIGAKRSGLTQSAIILKAWGVTKSGTNPKWKMAREKYNSILKDAGLN